MSNFLPHDATPEEQANAREVLAALFQADALGSKHSVLTPAEVSVVEALRLRIRARLRHTGHEDKGAYDQAARRLLYAAQDIKAEQSRMTVRHAAPIRRVHKDGTVCGLKSTASCTEIHTGYTATCKADGCDWTSSADIRAIVEEAKRTHLSKAGAAR